MDTAISHVVVGGGGTAGWLNAWQIAVAARPAAALSITVTVVDLLNESTVGVGNPVYVARDAGSHRLRHRRGRILARLH
ncbi:hypothetical protein [Sphingomonas sp. Leaf242]|uniref:hypothetical protein n=1 Tax=Sphingomonas sp. Leaf242 TaxID=1736304 RepID=UPI000A687E83|nr:hypothetical protein [Sphingomonas sp. Leaf242]